MMALISRHLLESTLFCLLLCVLASCFRQAAAARYAIRLIGISKFAIPSVLLAPAGARIAVLWPATSWLASVVHAVSATLAALVGMLPSAIEIGHTAIDRVILFIWFLGAAAMFAAWIARFQKSSYRLTLPFEREQQIMNRALDSLGIHAVIPLRVSHALDGPALRGVWRPAVIVPAGLSEKLNHGEFHAVLLHEITHALRSDNLAAMFVHSLVCVFWFHPLLWIVERRLNLEREHACDEVVLACGIPSQTYAASILKVCKIHLFDAVSGVSAATGSCIKLRLDYILKDRHSTRLSYAPKLLIAGLAILMTTVPIAGGYCQQCVSSGRALTAGRHTCFGARDPALRRLCSK
ncbi:MAG: M56 family metallopeptidase [Bryobacteraceae bacterium]